MSFADLDPETTARSTLRLLEIRLRRVEFLLTGTLSTRAESHVSAVLPRNGSSEETVIGRLKKLQSDLEGLRNLRGSAGDIVRDIESLHSKAPEAFSATSLPVSSAISDLSSTSSVVLAHATLFPESASRLASLQTLQIPSAEHSNKLVSLRSRIDLALQKQADLEAKAEDLQYRSAKCLEWWVKIGVVGMGEVWEDWESRLQEIDRTVRRAERRAADEDGYA